MAANPVIARMLVNLFKLRLDPEKADEAGAAAQVSAIEQALERVANLNEDRVLRQYLAVILATTRTNFWRRDEEGRGAPISRSSSIRRRCRAFPSRSRC